MIIEGYIYIEEQCTNFTRKSFCKRNFKNGSQRMSPPTGKSIIDVF